MTDKQYFSSMNICCMRPDETANKPPLAHFNDVGL